jgi:hypothetical protein
MDFIVDGMATGPMVRILSVVDAYTRECLALEADTSLGSGRGLEGWAGAYPARPSEAERPRRELPRQAARRVPQRNLVPDAQRCPVYSGNLA